VGDVQQLVDDVLNEGVFDVTSAQALRWLTRRHRKMVARSRCWRYETSLGGTVAAQGEYALPAGLVEIDEVTVGGDAYGKANHVDAGRVAAGRMFVLGDGGLFSGGEDNQGAGTVTLLPVPVDSGVPIVLRGAFLPPDLQTADDSTLKVPGDFTDALVSGAIATGLSRTENRPDLAQYHEQVFSDACDELRRQVNRRYRGSGPATIRIQGLTI
jgi:hypothetical protein